jgi:hypothetical protein
MLRRFRAVALLAALLAPGCGRKAPAPPPPPGPAPVTNGGGTTPTPVLTDPEGGQARPVPEKDKSVTYRSIFRIVKAGEDVIIDDVSLAREYEKRIWKLEHPELEAKFKKLPDDSHIYLCLEGTRIWEKHWIAPKGKVGEKNEYTLKVSRIVWDKDQNIYIGEMGMLEDEIDEQYFRVCTEDPRKTLAELRKVQQSAAELGFKAEDRKALDPVLPIHDFVSSVETICALMDEIEKSTGDAAEIIARLKLQNAWERMPFNPAAGGMDDERGKKAEEARTMKGKLAGDELLERIKTHGVKLDAEGARQVLDKTTSTHVVRLMGMANSAGAKRMAWELGMAVCAARPAEGPGRTDQRKTALSALKSYATSDPEFWKNWSDEELKTFPGALKDAVIGFTKGDIIASRNAWMPLESLKKARPGLAFTPPIDDVIKELKAK